METFSSRLGEGSGAMTTDGGVEVIDQAFVPRRAAVASVEIDGEVVLAREGSTLYRLDPLATLVWSCLDGSGTVGEIAEDLAAEFGADPDVVRRDVVALSGTLARLCFLEDAGSEPDGVANAEAPRAVPRRLVEPPSG